MIEVFTAIFTFWNYIEEANLLKKIAIVIWKYLKFIRWYWKNPEVRIKYSRIITTKTDDKTLDNIHKALVENNIRFGDDIEKTDSKFNFEILNSRLSYRIKIDRINSFKDTLIFESKYLSFFPIRKFRKLNYITSEFNKIYEIIANPLKISNSDYIIFVEIQEIENMNNNLEKINKSGAEIIFKRDKIQINNFHGSEQGEFLFYFLMKWIDDYRNTK